MRHLYGRVTVQLPSKDMDEVGKYHRKADTKWFPILSESLDDSLIGWTFLLNEWHLRI
jgi:hypothetical protein